MRANEPGSTLEERGMAFLDRARVVRGLSVHQIALIERRLNAPQVISRGRMLIPAVVGLVLILSGGGALAWVTGTLHRLPVLGPMWAPRVERPRPSATHTTESAPIQAPALVPSQEPRLAPAPSESPAGSTSVRAPSAAVKGTVHKSTPGRALPRIAPSPSDPEAEPAAHESAPTERPDSPIVAEGKSFAAVLSLWRQALDGPAALAALDAHERRFPAGQMALEARLLRAEILLAGHREAEALAILDKVSLVSVPRSRELRTLRGELRVKAGRCEDARADLDAIARGADSLARRAQNALGYCK
jgi:hypothetical protein